MANIDIFLTDLCIFWSNFDVTGVFALFESGGGVNKGYLSNVKKTTLLAYIGFPLI